MHFLVGTGIVGSVEYYQLTRIIYWVDGILGCNETLFDLVPPLIEYICTEYFETEQGDQFRLWLMYALSNVIHVYKCVKSCKYTCRIVGAVQAPTLCRNCTLSFMYYCIYACTLM